MKRLALMLLGFAIVANASIMLLSWEDEDPEAYRTLPKAPFIDTVYEFEVPSGTYIFVTWGLCLASEGLRTESHIRVDGEVIPWTIQRYWYYSDDKNWGSPYTLGAYQALFEPSSESHLIQLIALNRDTFPGPAYKRAALQVRIDTPDEQQTVNEQPGDERERLPTRSVLSSQPYITLPGVQDVYAITGERMDVVSDDRIELSKLPVGTYVAKTSSGTVKIVKVR